MKKVTNLNCGMSIGLDIVFSEKSQVHRITPKKTLKKVMDVLLVPLSHKFQSVLLHDEQFSR